MGYLEHAALLVGSPLSILMKECPNVLTTSKYGASIQENEEIFRVISGKFLGILSLRLGLTLGYVVLEKLYF